MFASAAKVRNNQLAEVKKIADTVVGFLGSREGPVLYKCARNCTGKGVIVEIGSWQGRSTIWLGKGSKKGNGVKIFAVDPHTGSSEHRKIYGEVWTFDEFQNNISKAEVDNIIVPILGTSQEACKDITEPVELIFIDGAHEYDSVKLDFELWFPKVMDGGIMIFHDKEWPGVKKVIEKSVLKSKHFKNVSLVRNTSLVIAEKTARNSLIDRAKNICLLLLLRLDFKSRLRKIKASARNMGKAPREDEPIERK